MAEIVGPTVYQWELRRQAATDADADRDRELMTKFMNAHGIDPMAFLEGNSLVVRWRDDGTLWLDAWRAVGNDSRTAPLCPHCPGCIQQERVQVPLAAPAPRVKGAFVAEYAAALGLQIAE